MFGGVTRLPDVEPGEGVGQDGVLSPGTRVIVASQHVNIGTYVSVAPATTASLWCPWVRSEWEVKPRESKGRRLQQTSVEGTHSSLTGRTARLIAN